MKQPCWAAISSGVLLALFCLTAQAGADSPSPPRAGTELFVDDIHIGRKENVTRRTHAAIKLDHPVIEPDKPWEGTYAVYIYGTVVRDPASGGFRMWYGSSGKMLYATSQDGITWTKPELDVIESAGVKTNAVLQKSSEIAVLVDDSEPDPARRYKALVARPIREGGFRVVGDEVWYYYTGISGSHGAPVPPKRITICLAKWRLDGFVSLDAGDTAGAVETTPITNRTGLLEINADAAHGQITVEVLDREGSVIAGYASADCQPLTTDGVRQMVKWTGHNRLPKESPFRLRFRLRNASLFSYTIKER